MDNDKDLKRRTFGPIMDPKDVGRIIEHTLERDLVQARITEHPEFLALDDHDKYLTKPDKNIKWEKKLKKELKNPILLGWIDDYLEHKKISTTGEKYPKYGASGRLNISKAASANINGGEHQSREVNNLPLPQVNSDNEKIERFKKQRDSMEEKLKIANEKNNIIEDKFKIFKADYHDVCLERNKLLLFIEGKGFNESKINEFIRMKEFYKKCTCGAK
jgi:hypothetical protein